MKATSGNLTLAQAYRLETVHYGASTCQNCGNYIKNIAEVVGSEDNRHYYIGIDCASTLTGIEPDRVAQAKKIFRKKAQARREVSKGRFDKILIKGDIKGDIVRFYSNYTTKPRFYRIQGDYAEFEEAIADGVEHRRERGYEPIAIYAINDWENW